MIQVRIKSKQYHGEYYVATIYHSKAECKSFGFTVVDYHDPLIKRGDYVECIEGLLVPVLKVTDVVVKGRGKNRFIYFPKLRFNVKNKVFSYNIDAISGDRYRLSASEKLYAGYISSGLSMFDAALKTWQGKKTGYYIVAIKRLFNNADFTEYLFSIMGKTLREELEARGINKGTIADEIASAVLQQDMVTGEKIRVPQNVRLWALGKASDVLERGGQQQGNTTNNILVVSPDAIREQMQSKLSPMRTDHQELDVSSGSLALAAMALPEPYESPSSQDEESLQR